MRDADDRRFFYGGMAHEGVFEINGADPLAAGFYEILGAVDDLDEALVVHVGDVSGAEPAVGGPAVGLVGRIVVATGNPWSAHFELARSFAVARRFHHPAIGLIFRVLRPHHAELNEGGRPALLAAHFVLRVFTPITHMSF